MRAIRAERADVRIRVMLYRCFAWDERAGDAEPDGPLWFPRIYQGEGRHDNPDRLRLPLSRRPLQLSTVVEQLARFRGQRLLPSLLRRRGLPLALAELELDDDARARGSRRSHRAAAGAPAALAGRDARPAHHAAAGPGAARFATARRPACAGGPSMKPSGST